MLNGNNFATLFGVALYARAWVEIRSYRFYFTYPTVALYARAWVEIITYKIHNMKS